MRSAGTVRRTPDTLRRSRRDAPRSCRDRRSRCARERPPARAARSSPRCARDRARTDDPPEAALHAWSLLAAGTARHIRAIAEQAVLLALPVAKLFGFALVVLLLALGETDVDLDASLLVMEIQRHQGVAGALDLAHETIDLLAMHEELARARRVGAHVGGCRGEWGDVRKIGRA